MKKSSIIALAIFVALIVVAVPLYIYTRPAQVEEGTISVRGQVSNPQNLTFNQLKSINPATVQVTLSSSSHVSDNGVFNYTGVQLKVLLDQAQVSETATSVFVQASDGYGTSIPIQDAMNPKTIIAYQKDGAALSELKDGGEGPLRLIIGNDQYAQRWIRGVAAIEVQ